MDGAVWETGLEFAKIPEGTEVRMSFNKNPQLMIVELPAGELPITESFNECPAICELIAHGEAPADYPSDSFLNVDKTKCVLHVPAGSIDLYRAAPGWSDFINILPLMDSSTTVESVKALETTSAPEYYTIDGMRHDHPASGINIVKTGSKVSKKVYK